MDQLSYIFPSRASLINFFSLLVLAVAIPLGLFLIKSQHLLKSQASEPPVVFLEGQCISKKGDNLVATCEDISLKVTSPLGGPKTEDTGGGNTCDPKEKDDAIIQRTWIKGDADECKKEEHKVTYTCQDKDKKIKESCIDGSPPPGGECDPKEKDDSVIQSSWTPVDLNTAECKKGKKKVTYECQGKNKKIDVGCSSGGLTGSCDPERFNKKEWYLEGNFCDPDVFGKKGEKYSCNQVSKFINDKKDSSCGSTKGVSKTLQFSLLKNAYADTVSCDPKEKDDSVIQSSWTPVDLNTAECKKGKKKVTYECQGKNKKIDVGCDGATNPTQGYTLSFKIAENLSDFAAAPEIPYDQISKVINYQLKSNTSGNKVIFVEFYGSRTGQPADLTRVRESGQIVLVDEDPVIETISCRVGIDGSSVSVNILGSRFGLTQGNLTSSGSSVNVLSWSNSGVAASVNTSSIADLPGSDLSLKLIRNDGIETEGVCKISGGGGNGIAKFSLSPASTTLNKGCNYTLDVNVDTGGSQVHGVDAVLNFDKNRISMNSIESGEIFPDYPGNLINSQGGKINVSGVAPPDQSFSGSGKLASLKVSIPEDAPEGTTTVNFDFDQNNKVKTTDSNITENGTNVDVLDSVENGTFTIGSGTCQGSTPTPSPSSTPPPDSDVDLSLGARVFCRAKGTTEVKDVQVDIKGEDEDNSTSEKVTIDKQGVVKGLSKKLKPNKKYKITVKAPKGLRKKAEIDIKTSGTFQVPNFSLPIGDVYPMVNGDGKINVQDRTYLYQSWDTGLISSERESTKSADLYPDGVINSFDWGCMRYDWGKSDDPL